MAFKVRKKERLSQDMKKRAGINELGEYQRGSILKFV